MKSCVPLYFQAPKQLMDSPTRYDSTEQLLAANTSPIYRNAPFDSSYSSQSSSSPTNHSIQPSASSGFNSSLSLAENSLPSPENQIDYTLPVSGYAPEEITITVEGRKVKVHGKHIENKVGGRKTHNEFTKLFDLPSRVSPENVRSYIKDGHTLHIIAHLSGDIQGAVHFLPIKRKW